MVLLGLTGLPANSKLAYNTSGQSTLLPDAVGSAGLSNVEEPLSHLLRRYIVYTMCSIPGLVEISPQILDVLLKIPGLRSMTEAVVRVTFFDQFVGGDTVQDMLPVLQSLRSTNKGAICVYSVEENPNAENSTSQTSDNAPHKRVVEEMLRAIDVAGDFEDSVSGKYVLDGSNDAPVGRRTWVAVKLTALLPSTKPLHHLSAYLLATRPESKTQNQ
ncbi:hypothetical protein K435DRAFT_357599 [Dendrothele bispora CBS 962.96]|uniref:Proline dehydrogenase n=1 Tax=Dendrothele bispora (strain CBS 962.96) TaxID=1314807 RepID=A0A4S8LDX0_DENBC|nr:hypothetical protein K435DRAFT_357599 [Dendrothele bispora CBS 962.96]